MDENTYAVEPAVQRTRRGLILSSAQVAVTAPAALLLLSATAKSAMASTQYTSNAVAVSVDGAEGQQIVVGADADNGMDDFIGFAPADTVDDA